MSFFFSSTRRTWLIIGMALGPAVLSGLYFPSFRLTYLAPLVVLFYYRLPMVRALWFSLACGTVIDLLAVDGRFGLHAVAYFLTTLLLYRQKRNLFEEGLTTLPILTFLFALISTSIRFIWGGHSPTVGWIAADLVGWPLGSGCYALLWFTLPLQVLARSRIR